MAEKLFWITNNDRTRQYEFQFDFTTDNEAHLGESGVNSLTFDDGTDSIDGIIWLFTSSFQESYMFDPQL